MRVGDVIIANDLIGFVTKINADTLSIKDKTGTVRDVNCSSAVELVSGHALAALLFTKLMQRASNAKSQV